MQETFDRGGNVVIPSFAVGRTQEMPHFIRQIKEEHRIHGHDNFPCLWTARWPANPPTIFRENFSECYDAEALALVTKGENPLAFPGLQISETKEDSVAINLDLPPRSSSPLPACVMPGASAITSSTTCGAGMHHPVCGVPVPRHAGARTDRGADEVRLLGETVQVNAQIRQMSGLSGHNRDGLLTWIRHFDPKPKHVFVNHGEDLVADHFARTLTAEGIPAEAPYNGAVYELTGGAVALLRQGTMVLLAKTSQPADKPRTSPAFERLLNMGTSGCWL